MDFTSSSEDETVRHARDFAGSLQSGDVLALHGDLGMGKSVFARALIRALTGDETLDVPSPTFTLVQTYDSEIGQISHFDCYRLEDPEEIYEIGWEEALESGLTILEWPSRLGTLLPARRIDITLEPLENAPDGRIIRIERQGGA